MKIAVSRVCAGSSIACKLGAQTEDRAQKLPVHAVARARLVAPLENNSASARLVLPVPAGPSIKTSFAQMYDRPFRINSWAFGSFSSRSGETNSFRAPPLGL